MRSEGTWRRPALLLIGWAAATLPEQPAIAIAASPALTGIRHFVSPAHTRLVLEFSATVEPAISAVPRLADGPLRRIYVDLPGAAVGADVERMVSFAEGPLSGVRVGRADPSTVRIAVLVRGAATYETARMDPPFRLVLDVRAPHPDGEQVRLASPSGSERRTGPGTSASVTVRDATRSRVPAPGTRTPRSAADLAAQTRRRGAQAEDTAGSPRAGAAGVTIVLDPGHGGKDPGASGVGEIKEKDVVLAIARRLAARIESEIGARVVLTRDRDEFLPLEARTARANAVGADLFISIHANASSQRSTSGVETYYLNNSEDRATIRLAAMENGLAVAGAQPHGGDLSYILSDLVQQGKLEDSIALSRALHGRLVDRLRHVNPALVDLGVKQGPFYVLVGAYMPCVLVEVAFLSHREEGRLLGTAAYQEAIAEGLLDGVGGYIKQLRRARTL